MSNQYFIHFKGLGDQFQVFLNDSHSFSNQKVENLLYKSFNGNFLYWSKDEYVIDAPGSWLTLERIGQISEFSGSLLCEALGFFWEIMPGHLQSLNSSILPRKYSLKNSDLDTLTFYGGSFNPWHEGHYECVDQGLRAGRNIVIIPDNNPWKEKRSNFNCWSEYKSLCTRLEKSDFSIFPGFWGAGSLNPTVSWIGEVNLKRKSLLMGDDSFFAIDKWKESSKLLAMLDSLFVVPRQGDEKERLKQKEAIEKQNKKLKIFFLNEHLYESISSTKIREMLK